MDTVMQHAAFARTYCNGQCCVASKRSIVHQSKIDGSAAAFASLQDYTVGDPLEGAPEWGP